MQTPTSRWKVCPGAPRALAGEIALALVKIQEERPLRVCAPLRVEEEEAHEKAAEEIGVSVIRQIAAREIDEDDVPLIEHLPEIFVATVRGVPSLPKTGAWSVVTRPVASVPPNGGEAVPVAENRGVPVIRRYPVRYAASDHNSYTAPRLDPGGGRRATTALPMRPTC
ncbi:MAG: hypothetical protein ACR2KT_10490 [Methylocella sp.]|nr:MAG: hypothetical protein DLM68_15250 [Hyphomicrobiales bacterium]